MGLLFFPIWVWDATWRPFWAARAPPLLLAESEPLSNPHPCLKIQIQFPSIFQYSIYLVRQSDWFAFFQLKLLPYTCTTVPCLSFFGPDLSIHPFSLKHPSFLLSLSSFPNDLFIHINPALPQVAWQKKKIIYSTSYLSSEVKQLLLK